MGHKSAVRPGLSSPDQSQDVEFSIDSEVAEGQQEEDEEEGRGPLGPPRLDKRYKSNHRRRDVEEQQEPQKAGNRQRDRFR